MTEKEIIERIGSLYRDRHLWQSDIAQSLHCPVEEIGYILRLLGYSRGKLVNETPSDDVLKDSYARLIAEKLSA